MYLWSNKVFHTKPSFPQIKFREGVGCLNIVQTNKFVQGQPLFKAGPPSGVKGQSPLLNEQSPAVQKSHISRLKPAIKYQKLLMNSD